MTNDQCHLWLDQDYGDISLRIKLRQVLHSQVSEVQLIEVFDSYAYGKLMRLANQIVISEHDEAIYSEGMVHPAMHLHQDPCRALVLGGGDGGMARELARYQHIDRIVVVEIDQAVVQASRDFFPSLAQGLDDARVELLIDDAHRYLGRYDSDPERFDIIIIDGAHLSDPASDTVQPQPFAEVLKHRLAPGGVVVCPLGSPQVHGDNARQSWHSLHDYWQSVAMYHITVPSLAGGSWCIGLAGITPDQWHCHDHSLAAEQLSFWEPRLLPRIFTLPKPLQRHFV